MGANLLTTAEYKAYIGINSINQDAAINSIIPKVSQYVKTYCRRTFVDHVSDPLTKVFKSGALDFVLEESPLIAVISVEFSDDYGYSYSGLNEFTDYVVDHEKNTVELINAYYQEINKVNAFKITYTGGFITIPEDLKIAIFDLVTYYLRHENALHTQKNVGANSVQIEYITNTGLPSHIRRILDLYKDNYA
jgi:hypothetical protein